MNPGATRPSSRRALHALLTANAISGFGNEMTLVAVPWFVLQTTGSVARTGATAFALVLPVVLSTFFGGVVVDRLGFRRSSILADVASGLTTAAIPLLYALDALGFTTLLVLVFLGALLDAPGTTARQSMIPEIAAGIRLERANAAFELVLQLKNLLAPAAAGLLIVRIGAAPVLWIDAATFAVSGLLVAIFIPRDAVARTRHAVTISRLGVELAEGLRFIRSTPVILWMALVSLVGNAMISPLFLLVMPVYADEVFRDAARLGLTLGAFGGAAIGGALVYGAFAHRAPRRLWYVGSQFGKTLGSLLLALTPGFAGAVVALGLMGLTSGSGRPLAATVRQELTPTELRGRVFGAIMALTTVAMPIGVVVTSVVLDAAGLASVLVIYAVVSVASLAVVLVHPAFRLLDSAPLHGAYNAPTIDR